MNTSDNKSSIQAEQVRQLFAGSTVSLVTSTVLAAILVYMQHNVISPAVVFGWFGSFMLVVIGRGALAAAYRRAQVAAPASAVWLRRFRLGVLAASFVWGAAGVLLFPANDISHQAFLAFVLAGLSAGGVIAYSVDLVCAIAFVLPVFTPFMIRLFAEGSDFSTAMGMTVALFLGFVVASIRHIYRNMCDNIVLRLEALTREAVLQESEERLRQMFEGHASIMLLIDPGTGAIVDANAAAERFYGYPLARLRGMNIAQINILSGAEIEVELAKAAREERNYFVFSHRLANGEIRTVEVHSSPISVAGRVLLFSIIHDITERHAAEAKLRLRDAALDAAANAMIITDPKGTILWANKAFAKLSGYSVEETLGRTPKELVNSGLQDQSFYEKFWRTILSGQVWHGELINRRKDGALFNEEMSITPVKNASGEVTHFVAVKQDISVRKMTEAKMHDLAFYDPLTHLPNRRLLLDRLNKALATATRTRSHGALMFLDLDYFKKLNDVHGHDIGDLLLVEVAQRLISCIREQDSAARLGGDEFIVMLEDLSGNIEEAARQVEAVAEKIRAALAQPYHLKPTAVFDDSETIEHHCTSSIGVTLFRDHDESVEDLLKWTDLAMYQAKSAGRNLIRFFDPAMQTAVEVRAALEADLRTALKARQLKLYYQIQVNNSRRAQGAEVLLRWDHPQRGLVSPMQFIPLAEETGLILAIGQWVLDTACAQLKAWQSNPLMRDLQLAVNVSAKQFRQADFVEQVKATIQCHGINPLLLKLELTESMVLENVDDTVAKMQALKDYGVRFSLDDFGTGYSSLAYLKRLPLDQIKIDQSFVREITSDRGDMVMVLTMVDLGMNFELEVIAEGVETEAQLKLLQRYGCGNFQGYLFGKPVPVEEFEVLLR